MSAWIMSVVGVICLGILLEIVLPEGQTAKYVKGAFSLLIVFVIASPLPALIKGDFKFTYDASAFEVDEKYVNSTYAMFTESIRERAEYMLKVGGYDTEVSIDITEESPVKLKGISVTVFNFKQDVAAAVEAEVKRILKETFKCSEDLITVRISETARASELPGAG